MATPLAIRRVPTASLHLDPANARQHPEGNLAAISASLATFGQAEPLVIHRPAGRVIGGNGRLVAMRELGWTECDVVELEISEVKATALGIALNRTAETAEWDPQALGKLLESLQAEGAIDGVGFDEDEIQALLDNLAGEADLDIDQDDVPAPPGAATTQRGDVWLLGRHRLLCGDSASSADVDRLLAGAPVHLLNCDPPYGVSVEPRSNNAIAAGLSSFTGTTHHQGLDLARHPGKSRATHTELRAKDRPLTNDFVFDDEEFKRLLGAWFGNASRVLLPGRSFYVWGGYRLELISALDVLGKETPLSTFTPARVLEYFTCDRVMKTKTSVAKARPTFLKTQRVLRLALVWA